MKHPWFKDYYQQENGNVGTPEQAPDGGSYLLVDSHQRLVDFLGMDIQAKMRDRRFASMKRKLNKGADGRMYYPNGEIAI